MLGGKHLANHGRGCGRAHFQNDCFGTSWYCNMRKTDAGFFGVVAMAALVRMLRRGVLLAASPGQLTTQSGALHPSHRKDKPMMKDLGSPNYCYPNAVDPHTFAPAGECPHLCWYCSHAQTYFLHQEPEASAFEKKVQAARNARLNKIESKTAAWERKEINSKFSFNYDNEEELRQSDAAIRALVEFVNVANARIRGDHSEAACLYAKAQQLWQKFEEETAVLIKPQPKSNGTVNGIEI
jgi:hypothetical protein